MGPSRVSFHTDIHAGCIVHELRADDESSDVDSAKATTLKKKLLKGKVDGKRRVERDSSRTLTSGNNSGASEEEPGITKEAEKGRKVKERQVKNKKEEMREKESDNSAPNSTGGSVSRSIPSRGDMSVSSSSSSESGSELSKTIQSTAKGKVLKKRKAQDDSSAASSSSDSDSDSELDEDGDPTVNPNAQVSSKNHATNATHSSEVQVTKKRKTSEDGTAVSTATTATSRTGESGTARPAGNGNKDNGRKINTPFQRFDPDKVPVHIVKDNRYEAKVSAVALVPFSPECEVLLPILFEPSAVYFRGWTKLITSHTVGWTQ